MADEELIDQIDTILDDIDEFWAIDVTDDLVDSLVLAYTAGLADSAMHIAELKGLSVGVSFDVTDPEVIEYLKDRAAEMVQNVNNGTRFYLRQMISAGFQEGVSEENLVKSILDGLFDVSDFSENRIRSIARFEIARAQSEGWVKQLTEVGVKKKVWRTVGEDACETCKENEAMGPQDTTSKPFLTVFKGEKTTGPPAHPNLCRCHLSIPDDELDKMGMSVEWYTGAAKGKSEVVEMGGKGSGHWRHAGRKGKRGGSAPSKGAAGGLGNKLQYMASADIVTEAESRTHRELEWATVRHAEGEQPASPEAIEIVSNKVVAQLEEDLTQPVAIRRGLHGANSVAEEGRFKTQFETGTSGGNFDTDTRLRAEQKGLGAPSDLAIDTRPVYGYFNTSSNKADRYGPVEFVLKDSVKERTTYTLGDSLFTFEGEGQVGGINPSSQGAWNGGVRPYLDGHLDYIEAQVQGGVTLGDVARVVIHGAPGGPHLKLQKVLEEKGVKVEYDRTTP